MPAPKDLFASRRWTEVDELKFRLVNGTIHTNMVDTLPTGTDTVEVYTQESWMKYRVRDTDGTILSVGIFPTWMVVSATVTV